MSEDFEKRREGDIEARSKSELIQEIACNNVSSDNSITHLVHELHVHQVELKAQNQELRQTQQQLEEVRDRYTNLYDFAPVGYITLNGSGRILEINLTGAAMLGWERQNIVGQTLSSVLTHKETKAFLQHLQQTFATQCNVVSEVKIATSGAVPRIVRLQSAAVQGEDSCHTVLIDITQQWLATEELHRNLAAQEALLKAIPAVVFYQDINLRFLAVSQAFADFFGYKIAHVIGKTAFDVLPQEVAEDFHRSSCQVLDTGVPSVVPEYAMHDLHGNRIYVSVVRAPYRDAKGEIIGLVGAGVDITAIKKAANLHAELLKENRVLTRSLFDAQEKERRHIARELHDELGQWLTAIQAEAHAICNISPPESEIFDSAKAISESASAVHEVVRGMLRNLRPNLLDELGLADSLREKQRQWCRTHPGVICEFNLDAPLAGLSENINITVYRLIQEALNNVATHSQASRVTVTLQREAENDPDEEVLMLNVEDDGVGFDTAQPTTGMGLLGMRERVIAAGGGFVMYSEPGKGTHIHASLPLNHGEHHEY